ncbi:MAG: hypothetical protein GX808_07110 [Syntrophomonadaceae bacterium]|nr:hypothetical protein [Syntrophomonadaceae bacterium]
MSLTDRLWGVIFNPVATMRQLTVQKPLGEGIFLYAAVLSIVMVINQGIDMLRPIEEVLSVPTNFIWLLLAMGIIFSLFLLLISAGFLSLISEIIYKRGNSLGLLVGFCFSILPGAFGPLLQYGSVLMGLSWLGVFFSIISMTWVVVLQIIAVKTALSLSTRQALFLYFSPLLLLAVIAITFTLLMVSSIPQLG